MTPAETLRKAATLMRERAEAASANEDWGTRPWQAEECSNDVAGNCPCIVSQGEDKPWDEPQLPAIQYVCDAETEEHAAYIAAMHPGVALVIAQWLEGEAWIAERKLPDNSNAIYPALAVASVYLGEVES